MCGRDPLAGPVRRLRRGSGPAWIDHDWVERLWGIAREMMREWTLNGSEKRRYLGNLTCAATASTPPA